MAETSRNVNPRPATLPDDLLLEILARVPYRSLCRFRCVSPSWRALCSDPSILRRSPQTLSGFFCHALGDLRDARFLNFPGGSGSGARRPLVDPSLPFLRGAGYAHGFVLVDCCGGLLLCECFTSPTPSSQLDRDYVVCNPATQDWTVLPRTQELHTWGVIRLGFDFDPAAPSRFAVFAFRRDLDNDGDFSVVEIYSSETGLWTSCHLGWGHHDKHLVSVFLNGSLHFVFDNGSSVLSVDMDGKTFRHSVTPYFDPEYLGQSQGLLHATEIDHRWILEVWVCEDYNWILKHAANISQLLGRHIRKEIEYYTLVAIHPECNVIFFIDWGEERLMSYDMDSQKVNVVYNKGEYYLQPHHPYTPCFAEWLPTR